jgi:hypothetical protein
MSSKLNVDTVNTNTVNTSAVNTGYTLCTDYEIPEVHGMLLGYSQLFDEGRIYVSPDDGGKFRITADRVTFAGHTTGPELYSNSILINDTVADIHHMGSGNSLTVGKLSSGYTIECANVATSATYKLSTAATGTMEIFNGGTVTLFKDNTSHVFTPGQYNVYADTSSTLHQVVLRNVNTGSSARSGLAMQTPSGVTWSVHGANSNDNFRVAVSGGSVTATTYQQIDPVSQEQTLYRATIEPTATLTGASWTSGMNSANCSVSGHKLGISKAMVFISFSVRLTDTLANGSSLVATTLGLPWRPSIRQAAAMASGRLLGVALLDTDGTVTLAAATEIGNNGNIYFSFAFYMG